MADHTVWQSWSKAYTYMLWKFKVEHRNLLTFCCYYLVWSISLKSIVAVVIIKRAILQSCTKVFYIFYWLYCFDYNCWCLQALSKFSFDCLRANFNEKSRNKKIHTQIYRRGYYARDLNSGAPIRFVQFVPRFFPRCPLYSFIISMGLTNYNTNNKQSRCTCEWCQCQCVGNNW